MAIAISDAHRELGSVAHSFLENNKARARRVRCSMHPRRVSPFWTISLRSGGSVCTSRRSSADRATACPSSPSCSRSSDVPSLPGRSSAPSSRRHSSSGRRRRAAIEPAPHVGRRHTSRRIGLAGSLHLDADGSLSGDAGAVLGAGMADVLVLRAGDDMVVVDASAPGVDIAVHPGLDPTRRTGRVTIRDPGRPERGAAGAFPVARQLAWILAAAEAAGGAEECVENAAAYAKDRLQFGRPIAMFQAVKHHCANMLVAAELATAAVWDAGRAASGDAEHSARGGNRSRAAPPGATGTPSSTFRCTAGSGSPGNTTATCCCAGPPRWQRCSTPVRPRPPSRGRRWPASPATTGSSSARGGGVPRRHPGRGHRSPRSRATRSSSASSTPDTCSRTGRSRGTRRPGARAARHRRGVRTRRPSAARSTASPGGSS